MDCGFPSCKNIAKNIVFKEHGIIWCYCCEDCFIKHYPDKKKILIDAVEKERHEFVQGLINIYRPFLQEKQ